MGEIDSGRTISDVARQLQLSPKLWSAGAANGARGELAFPGNRGRIGLIQKLLDRFIGEETLVSWSHTG